MRMYISIDDKLAEMLFIDAKKQLRGPREHVTYILREYFNNNRPKQSNDHIFLNESNLNPIIYCIICKDMYYPKLPVSIDKFIELTKEFAHMHRNCAEMQQSPEEGEE